MVMLKIIIFFFFTMNFAHSFTKANNVDSCKAISKGACYEITGRARLYNNKHVRIWRRGTNRMYQVMKQTGSAFFEIKHLSMATEINAEFDICFLKSEDQPGYAEICVQSVKNMKTSQMPE